MTRASFEMDDAMPNLTDDFDFGAFLNLPPDYVDQGVEDGPQKGHSLGPDCSWHSPTAWNYDEYGHAFDFMPNLCDERHLDIPCPSHNQTLLDSSDSAGAHQSTNFQPQTNNAVPGFGYGASNLYGEDFGASGCARPASAMAWKPTGSQTIATGYRGEDFTITSDQQSSPSLSSNSASHGGSENHCTCMSCLEVCSKSGLLVENNRYKCRFPGCLTSNISRTSLWDHESDHYWRNGRFTCLEHDCQVSTRYWYELKRHYKKHCTSPDKEIFSCPVLWCKYSGNNGFLRKDKLKSHYRNIHEGKPGPLKAGRVIKPATLKPRVSSVGNGPSKQNE